MKIFIETKIEMKKSKNLHVSAFIISEIKAGKEYLYRCYLNLIHILINFILTDFEIVTMKFPYEVPESRRRNKKS